MTFGAAFEWSAYCAPVHSRAIDARLHAELTIITGANVVDSRGACAWV